MVFLKFLQYNDFSAYILVEAGKELKISNELRKSKMTPASNSKLLQTIPLLIIVCLLSFPSHAQYSGGTGEPNDPYQIATTYDLILLGKSPEDYDKHFILTADIDLDPNLPGRKVFDTAVIASFPDDTEGRVQGALFNGVLDGNSHTISNFSCTSTRTGFIGLFGCVLGEVKDLKLKGSRIDAIAADNVGSLVGYLAYGSILSGCSVQNTTVRGGTIVGGLVGYNEGTITNCCSSCVVDGNSVGGLVGMNVFGEISNCYSTGTISGNSPVGGLLGQNGESFTWEMISGGIYRCYSICSVIGTTEVGGLVGLNYAGTVTQCYSSGDVSGNERVGGLVGENYARVTYSFWDVETSGLAVSAGGIGKTTTEMQSAETFLGWGGCDSIWTIDEGYDYPRFAWENIPGKVITGPTYGGGTGTAENPYLIYTAEQLNIIGLSICDLDKHFKLMADIDLSAFDGKDGLPVFNVIGSGLWDPFTRQWDAFTGVFDGNDHTISYLTLTGEDNLGMFGRLERGAQVRNLGIVDVNILGSGSFVGALAGESEGDLTRCYSSGIVRGDWSVGGLVGASFGWIDWGPVVIQCHSTCVVSGNDWLGGLVGNNGSFITQCYSTGEISGRDRVGGLVGYNSSNTVTKCYSTSVVSGDSDVGGLVGYNYKGSIAMSYSTGTVCGYESVGGLVGCNGRSLDSRDGSIITACYSTSTVIGNKDVGGLVGDQNHSRITTSFWNLEASGQITSAGGMGITTSAMQDINTYLNAGWDFVDEIVNGNCDYWQISPNQYPRLRYLTEDSPVMPEGLGTAQEPYLIRDARDLGTVWFKPIAHYRLETSLDLSGIIWSMAVVPWFGGTFDGNGYVISNLQIQCGSYLGLFGELGPEAELSNLGLEAVNINGDWNVGGLAGKSSAIITNCHSTGTVTGHNFYVGGLVGSNGLGSIDASYSTGMVSGYAWVGGLVGENYQGSVNTSYSTATVIGHSHIGGLVGGNRGSIATSYSTGTVSGDVWVGGLVGDNMWYFGWPKELRGIIRNSYSISAVNGETNVGGFVGENNRGSIATSFSTGLVSGISSVGGLVGNAGYDNDYGYIATSFWDIDTSGQAISAGGTGKTTGKMQMASTFLDSDWDFVDETANGTEDIWWILEGQDYPRLWWENDSN